MPLTPISLGVRSNPGRTGAISAARLVNCRAMDAGEEGKIRFPVVACDGFESWSSSLSGISGSGTHRGGLVLSDSAMYVASGTRIVKLNTSGSPTAITAKTATFTVTLATPAVFTWTAHGLKAGAAFVPTTSGALPTGLVSGTTYYVISTGLTADAFQVSATPGGSAVNTSVSQSGTHTGTAGAGTIVSTGLITMARNRREPNAQIGIISSASNKFYILENDTLVDYSGLVTSLDSAGTLTSIAAIDGYLILFFDNGEFFASDIDDGGTIDTLNFAKAESNPDGGVKVLTRGRDVMLAGTASTEFWQNTGATDFPFERTTTADYGCYSAGSMIAVTHAKPGGSVIDTIAMAATDAKGAFIGVVLLDGYSALKISTEAIDRAILAESDKTTIKAKCYTEAGSVIYAISGSAFTWEYDFSTGFWTERTSDGLAFHRISDAFSFNGQRIVADYALAKYYKLRNDLYDASNASTVTLKHSNNNGNTWLVTRTAKTLSGSSNLTQRVKFNRLGQSREDGKVFNITISKAVMEDTVANDMAIQPPAVHAWPKRMRFFKIYIDTIPGGSQTSTVKGVTGLAIDAVALAA